MAFPNTYTKVGPWANGAPPALSAANLDQVETQYDEMVENFAILHKPADEVVNNSAVLQNDDDLFFAVGANEIWEFNVLLELDADLNADFKVAFSIPAAGAIRVLWSDVLAATAGGAATLSYGGTVARNLNTTGIGTKELVKIEGVYIGGANAGNVQLQWAQSVAQANNLTVYKGSKLVAHRLA